MATGAFVVLEGGEGSGKSTQARLLAAQLRDDGREVVLTFEPGATPRGVALRAALLDDDRPLDPRAELLLLSADRAQHVEEVIRPALERGAIVVCDRHTPSSIVYQGDARGLGVDAVAEICRYATGGLFPDVVVVLDVSEQVAAERRPEATDRIERAGPEFHTLVRAAYRSLAPRFAWTLVDGEGPPEVVAERVRAAVSPVVDRR